MQRVRLPLLLWTWIIRLAQHARGHPPAALRRVLRDAIEVREKIDYTLEVARRVLQEAQDFVLAIQENIQ